MPISLVDALWRVRVDIANLLESEAPRQHSRDRGHRWSERVLDPVTTVHLFALQVLHGNIACLHLSEFALTDSANCVVRSRLRLAVLRAHATGQGLPHPSRRGLGS